MEKFIEISENVKNAILKNNPVIALESTIITHGMPYPDNFNTTIELMNIAKNNNVVPAVIGILEGGVKIGLTEGEIEILSKCKNCFKAAAKDIPFCITKKLSAGTTVSATMFLAKFAGIKVFATGGIGGVHRGVNETYDISSDLFQFRETDEIVVSAGCKSILDIPKTLEYLETIGVPVVGYKTNVFPAFYSRNSDIHIDIFVDNPSDIAAMYNVSKTIGLNRGMLIANPVPAEFEIPLNEIEKYIQLAYDEMENYDENKYTGKNLTPYLLSKIVEYSKGRSLKTNIELVKNNVELACKIAKEIIK